MRDDPLLGRTLAGFRIEAALRRGGMGRIYRATQLSVGRVVAVKILAPELAEDESFRSRFLHESQLASSIEHPNILPVYDAGEVDGFLFMAMRLVEGAAVDVGAMLASEGPPGLQRAIGIVEQVASALDAAHDHGLVHRDVKPGNLLVAGEHVYLTDFGVAKPALARRELTRTGVFVGTLDYASPEQIKNEPLDARTDIYSLGAVVFHLLTGHLPFDRQSDYEVMKAHLSEPTPPLERFVDGLPEALNGVIAIAMAKERDDRYRTARRLADELRSASSGSSKPAQGNAHDVPVRSVASPTRLADAGTAAATTKAAVPSTLPNETPPSGPTQERTRPPAMAGRSAGALALGVGVLLAVASIGTLAASQQASQRPSSETLSGLSDASPSTALQTNATATNAPARSAAAAGSPSPSPSGSVAEAAAATAAGASAPAAASTPPAATNVPVTSTPRIFRVTGTIRDSVTNAAVPAAQVTAYLPTGSFPTISTTTTDANGNFSLSLPEETYRFRLSSPTGAFQSQDWTGSLTVDRDRSGVSISVLRPSERPLHDARAAAQAPFQTVAAGATVNVWFNIINTGAATWRSSEGYGYRGLYGWTGRTFSLSRDIGPGQTDAFATNVTIPGSVGLHRYGVTLTRNGVDFGPSFYVDVSVPNRAVGFDATYAGESAFLTLNPGQSGTFTVFFQNTGTTAWVRGTSTQVDLAACLEDKVTCNQQDSTEAPFNSGWLSSARYTTHTQNTVLPGAIGTFTWNASVPGGQPPGVFRFNGALVVSSTGQDVRNEGFYQDIRVPGASNSACAPTAVSLTITLGSSSASPTARVTCSGSPMPGVQVTFVVDAASGDTNPDLTLTATTGASGDALVTYSRTFAGTDTITAYPTSNPVIRASGTVRWTSQ